MLYVLGEAALRTAVLAGILHSIFMLLRVRRTRLLLAAWTIVLVTSLLMPLLLRSSPLSVPLDNAVPQVLIDSATDLMLQPSIPAPVGSPGIETQMRPSMTATWLETVYFVVGCSLCFRALLGVGLSLRILTKATPACHEWAVGFRVRLSRDVAGPVTIARTIVLPTDAVDWPTEMRQAVLAHEYAHVSRMDYAMLVVSQLNRAMFWFSPLSWWLHRRLAMLTELVSDDQALEITLDRIGYAETLLTMAQRSGSITRGLSMASFSMLPLRIDRILNDEVTSPRVGRWQWTTLTLGVAIFSLMSANFVPSIALMPVATYPSDLSFREVEIGKPTQEALPSALLPPDKGLEAKVFITKSVAQSITRTQQTKVAVRTRPTIQVPTKTMLSTSSNRSEEATRSTPISQERFTPPTPSVVDQKETGIQRKDTRDFAAAPGNSVIQRNETLYPRQMTEPLLHSNIDRLNGSTCVGTVSVGAGAYYSGGELLMPRAC